MDAIGLIFGGIIVAIGGIALVWLARKSAAGTLARNGLAGVRTAVTMASDTAWYPAQAAAAPATAVAGWGGIAGGVLSALACAFALGNAAPEWFVVLGLVLLIVAAVWVLAWVIVGGVRGTRAGAEAAPTP